jgi:signal transduction histidine kinase
VLWKPVYWLAGDVKLITALASVVTAIALPGLVPQVHAMLESARLSEERRAQLEKANQELQQLTAHIINVQDEERRRIARELHDGVGQYLAAIKMSCEVALKDSKANRSPKVLEESLNLIDRCTSEVRTMSHLLHPPLLEEMGLSSAIPWLVDGFRKRSGIAVRLEMPSDLPRLSQPVELVLFRVLQESLTNIHRHSKSQSASISISCDESDIRISIEDTGVGFAADGDGSKTAGVGIAGMRERVRELKGEMRIASSASGTRLEVRLPVSETPCPSAS